MQKLHQAFSTAPVLQPVYSVEFVHVPFIFQTSRKTAEGGLKVSAVFLNMFANLLPVLSMLGPKLISSSFFIQSSIQRLKYFL